MANSEEKPEEGPAHEASESFERFAGWKDEWVGKIVTDPAAVPSVTLLVGYLADAPEADTLRLYFDPSLARCVDIPIDQIVHREPIPQAFSALGGSYVWINSAGWFRCKLRVRHH